ncbi:DUF3667 domain-containing protein [Terrimonas rubra]|uniref:DUF3667 domain-containing protein n=1 Tax=Terrimonas rubra TaxID=1035890 RepID=A0ABW6A6F4_9BACT
MENSSCINCQHRYAGNFCPQCGQSSHEGRINAHYFLHDIPHSVFHIDKGFFYTLKCLFTRPGYMIEEYLEGKRVKHFRPFAYVIIMSAICTFLIKGIEWLTHKIITVNYPDTVIAVHENFFAHYFSVFIFIMIPFASLVTWLTFYKRKYNYWEHFLANTYIAAQLNLILVLIRLVGLLVVLFTQKQDTNIDFKWFLMVFMMGFLFMYGNVFGVLMRAKYKLAKIILILTLMNSILAILYLLGFSLTGLVKFM